MADDLDRDRACVAALAAAEDALADLERLNERRQSDGKAILEAGIALHAGAVTYGNIGAPDRLDFTVIGAAVNFVTRLERMCGQLGRPLLASAGFASPCGSKLVFDRALSPARHGTGTGSFCAAAGCWQPPRRGPMMARTRHGRQMTLSSTKHIS
jgi:class 3 adenylate cyclase